MPWKLFFHIMKLPVRGITLWCLLPLGSASHEKQVIVFIRCAIDMTNVIWMEGIFINQSSIFLLFFTIKQIACWITQRKVKKCYSLKVQNNVFIYLWKRIWFSISRPRRDFVLKKHISPPRDAFWKSKEIIPYFGEICLFIFLLTFALQESYWLKVLCFRNNDRRAWWHF